MLVFIGKQLFWSAHLLAQITHVYIKSCYLHLEMYVFLHIWTAFFKKWPFNCHGILELTLRSDEGRPLTPLRAMACVANQTCEDSPMLVPVFVHSQKLFKKLQFCGR